MHDRSNNGENSSGSNEHSKHDRPQWVTKYLDLADTALQRDDEDQEHQPAA